MCSQLLDWVYSTNIFELFGNKINNLIVTKACKHVIPARTGKGAMNLTK
jgi:hypothetical protein